jgi:integrase
MGLIDRESLFETAAEDWRQLHSLYIKESTAKAYRDYIRGLLTYFKGMKLSEIAENPARLHIFQTKRKEHAGNERINHECNTLSQILRAAGVWEQLKPFYKPLPVDHADTPGKALLPEQAQKLFATASRSKRWQVAYWASVLSTNTTAGPGEIRHLRLGDIDLDRREIYVQRGVKNKFRRRPLPLNAPAYWAITQALERAQELGASLPTHYLFPHRRKSGGKYAKETHDVTKPIGSWKTAWYALTAKAGLKGLRRYDLRHHAITTLLENPDVSERVVKDLAGQVSRKIIDRYSHIREKARRDAVDSLDRKGPVSSKPVLVETVEKRDETA